MAVGNKLDQAEPGVRDNSVDSVSSFFVGWQRDKVLNVLSHMELYNLLWNVHLLVVLCE
jgi:hypothetical protein